MHKNTPKSFFYLDFWEVIYVQKIQLYSIAEMFD